MLVGADRPGLGHQDHIALLGLVLLIMDLEAAAAAHQLMVERVLYEALDGDHRGLVHLATEHHRGLHPGLGPLFLRRH